MYYIPGTLSTVSNWYIYLLGCSTLERWCSVGDPAAPHYVPSHFYIIIQHEENRVFSALIPWRTRNEIECRIVNENECRNVYPADFNCQKPTSPEDNPEDNWWKEQIHLHSAKVIEIEKLTNLKEG